MRRRFTPVGFPDRVRPRPPQIQNRAGIVQSVDLQFSFTHYFFGPSGTLGWDSIRRFVMKKLITGFIGLVAFVASPAFADKGFSAGASIGYSNVSIEDDGFGVDLTGTGYKVFGTYMFNDNFGIEGGWLSFGEPSDTVGGFDLEVDADGFDVFAVGALPVSDTVDLFAKAGMLAWDATASINGFEDSSESGEDLALGIGGRFTGASGFGVRAEYEWFDFADADSVWMISLGFEYNFR
jgi:OOP family OmpA-OmpF porin